MEYSMGILNNLSVAQMHPACTYRYNVQYRYNLTEYFDDVQLTAINCSFSEAKREREIFKKSIQIIFI